MRSRLLAATFAAAALCGGSEGGAEEKQFAEIVNTAIDNGVAWLRQRESTAGSWGNMKDPRATAYNGSSDTYDFPAGPTALSLYTLLKCGVAPADEGIAKGFEFLKKFDR